jgi:hypothetical protein
VVESLFVQATVGLSPKVSNFVAVVINVNFVNVVNKGKVFDSHSIYSFSSPSIKRERVYLEVYAIEIIAEGGGLVSKLAPFLGALDRLTSRCASLNVRNVLAVGKVNNTNKTCSHS